MLRTCMCCTNFWITELLKVATLVQLKLNTVGQQEHEGRRVSRHKTAKCNWKFYLDKMLFFPSDFSEVKTSEVFWSIIFTWAQSLMYYTSSHLLYLKQKLQNESMNNMNVLFIFLRHMLRTLQTTSQLDSVAVFPIRKASHIKICHAA